MVDINYKWAILICWKVFDEQKESFLWMVISVHLVFQTYYFFKERNMSMTR